MVNLRIRRPNVPARRALFEDWPNIDELQRDIFSSLPMWMGRNTESMSDTTWSPSVDIVEKDDSWIFKAELPEVKLEDINVTVEEGILSIKGERKFEEEVTEGNYTRLERSYGSFERRFSLPSGIDPDSVTADYKNGLLTLKVPKKEEAKPKAIKIDVK